MDRAEIERIAQSVAEGANKFINASNALILMKRCVDENLGSVTIDQKQCDALIWMMQVLREGPSDG